MSAPPRSRVRLVDELFDLGLGDEVLEYTGKKDTRVLVAVNKRYRDVARNTDAFTPVVWDCGIVDDEYRGGWYETTYSIDLYSKGLVFQKPASRLRGSPVVDLTRFVSAEYVDPPETADEDACVIMSEGDTIHVWTTTDIARRPPREPNVALVTRDRYGWNAIRYNEMGGDMLDDMVFPLYYRYGPCLDARRAIVPKPLRDMEDLGVDVPLWFSTFRGWSNRTLGMGAGASLSDIYKKMESVPSTEFKLDHVPDQNLYVMTVPASGTIPEECPTFFVTTSQKSPKVPLFIFLSDEYYSYD